MGTVVAIGQGDALDGLALAGVPVVRAESPAAVEAAWAALGDEVSLVILSPDAATAVAGRRAERPDLLSVVTP
jgi:vacuolar-type H+-ATPase subunit F/Vma7